jgi:hypothetical protein
MILQRKYLIFGEEGDRYASTSLNVENGDRIEYCNIYGGEIRKAEDDDIIFKECDIIDCGYSIKEFEGASPRCPIVDSCRITNCKLPHAYYFNCFFRNNGKEEFSIPYGGNPKKYVYTI